MSYYLQILKRIILLIKRRERVIKDLSFKLSNILNLDKDTFSSPIIEEYRLLERLLRRFKSLLFHLISPCFLIIFLVIDDFSECILIR